MSPRSSGSRRLHGTGLGAYLAPRLVGRGGAAALGVDTTCYAQADILGEARALLDAERRDAGATAGGIPRPVLPARTALELATSTGARAIGLQDEVGSLRASARTSRSSTRTRYEPVPAPTP
ncbi:hypothetical protein [Streptomyces diastatochromogenes]|uniref:hypothetical protein n=1 Tax=Streptomyces diastatochromogenes TaxID=42236 RepID=UPI0036ADB6D3